MVVLHLSFAAVVILLTWVLIKHVILHKECECQCDKEEDKEREDVRVEQWETLKWLLHVNSQTQLPQTTV